MTDITYIWTREGWLYLAAILDLFSRRVVGWAMVRTSTELALDALGMALRTRRPRLASSITRTAASSTRARTTGAGSANAESSAA